MDTNEILDNINTKNLSALQKNVDIKMREIFATQRESVKQEIVSRIFSPVEEDV